MRKCPSDQGSLTRIQETGLVFRNETFVTTLEWTVWKWTPYPYPLFRERRGRPRGVLRQGMDPLARRRHGDVDETGVGALPPQSPVLSLQRE